MGLFDRLYMGKSNKPDFTPDQLPSNRFALFFDMLKLNFFKIFGANLLFDVFMIPTILWIMMNVQLILELEDSFATDGYLNFFLMLLIPLLTLAGPAYASVTLLCRKWASDDHAWVWSDFWRGFKENWKQGLLVMFITSLVIFLCYFAQMFYGLMSYDNIGFFIMQVIMIIMLAVVFAINLYIWPMMVTYEMTLKQLIVNSLILALGRLPFTVIFGIAALLPFILLIFVHPFIALYFPLIGFALSTFINASYANSAFDKYLNPRIEGAEVGRGLRKKPEWEDEKVD